MRPRFETAMHPQILLRRAHNFGLDNFIDKRCGFAFIFRIVAISGEMCRR